MIGKNSSYLNSYKSYSIIAIVVIAVAIWQYVAAPFLDDFIYRHIALDTCENDFWNAEGPLINNLSDAIVSSINHYKVVNGRLSNIIVTLSQLFPTIIIDILHGVAVGVMIYFIILNIADIKTLKSTWITALISLIIWKYLPWHDGMVSSCFLFNYPWACALALIYSYIFIFRPSWIFDKEKKFVIFILCVVTGWYHEGFSIPLLCGCISVVLIHPENRKNRLVLLGLLFIGTLLCTMAPSTLGRIDRENLIVELYDYLINFGVLLSKFYPLYIAIGVILFVAIKKDKVWTINVVRKNVYWIVVTLCSLFMAVVLHRTGGRILWLASVSMLICSFSILYDSFDKVRAPRNIISGIITCVVILFLVELIYWQNKVSQGQCSVIEKIEATRESVIYEDLIHDEDVPWWVLGIPKQYSCSPPTVMYMSSSYLGTKNEEILLILPSHLENKPIEQWSKSKGDNPFFEASSVMIYSKSPVNKDSKMQLMVGEANIALSPMANMLTYFADKDISNAEIVHTRKGIMNGDTIYCHYISADRNGRYRKINSISLIDDNL